MARTRQQRRRLQTRIGIALVLTLLVVGFASDVSHSAHRAIDPRRSENRSFGALANTLVTQQDQFDLHASYLLAHASTMSRTVFDARLEQLNAVLPGWLTAAHQLRHPALAHSVNQTLARLTEARVAAYATVVDEVARALTLPLAASVSTAVDPAPLTTLATTTSQWQRARFSLVGEPGTVKLSGLTDLTGEFLTSHGLGGVTSAPSLALRRQISLSALRVQPAGLPASAGEIVLPPVSAVTFGVVVTNQAFCEQPVTLTFTVTPRGHLGATSRQTMSTILGPTRSFAFVPQVVKTVAQEQATVTITLRTPSSASAPSVTKTYQLKMSPSGLG